MKALTDRVEVTVEFAYNHMDADINMWTFNKDADEMGLDPWRHIELTQDSDGVSYYIGSYSTYSSHEKKVGPLYKIWVLKKDLPTPTLEEAANVIKELLVAMQRQHLGQHTSFRTGNDFLKRIEK